MEEKVKQLEERVEDLECQLLMLLVTLADKMRTEKGVDPQIAKIIVERVKKYKEEPKYEF